MTTTLPAYLQASAALFTPQPVTEYAIVQRVGAAAYGTQSPDFAPARAFAHALRQLQLLRAFHCLEQHDVRDSADPERPGFVAEKDGRFLASYEIVSTRK